MDLLVCKDTRMNGVRVSRPLSGCLETYHDADILNHVSSEQTAQHKRAMMRTDLQVQPH